MTVFLTSISFKLKVLNPSKIVLTHPLLRLAPFLSLPYEVFGYMTTVFLGLFKCLGTVFR